jgi:hypothetical protein
MRLEPLHVLVPLIVAAAVAVLLALDTSADASCEGANQRLANDQVRQAEKAFTAILDDEPDSRCAKNGIASVRKLLQDRQCRTADAARKAQLRSRALKDYQALLANDPTDRCAAKGVAAVVKELCARAAVLARHKAGEAAQKAYTAILGIEPLKTVEPCPAGGLVSEPSDRGEPKTIVIRGVDGKDGTAGKNGADGAPGEDGRDGKDGKDGNVIVLNGKG